MANVTDYSKLWQIHGALESLLTETAFIVGATDAVYSFDFFDWSGTEAARAAFNGNLEQFGGKVRELGPDGRIGLLVNNGELDPSKWLQIAQTMWDALVALQERAGTTAFRFTAVWGEVVVPTAVTVKERAVETAESVGSSAAPLLVLFAVIVVGLVVLKLS